jgi:tyrosinase
LDAEAPQDSPIFSGSDISMGSNGEYVANRSAIFFPPANITIPPGTGGGCVFSGPFSNFSVDLGPLLTPGLEPVSPKGAYNPRCLSRDLNPWITRQWMTFQNYTNLITQWSTIEFFQGVMQADPRLGPLTTKQLGVHGGGHFAVGATLTDLFTSPEDPAFFLHHAQIDRYVRQLCDKFFGARRVLFYFTGSTTNLLAIVSGRYGKVLICQTGKMPSSGPAHSSMCRPAPT